MDCGWVDGFFVVGDGGGGGFWFMDTCEGGLEESC